MGRKQAPKASNEEDMSRPERRICRSCGKRFVDGGGVRSGVARIVCGMVWCIAG